MQVTKSYQTSFKSGNSLFIHPEYPIRNAINASTFFATVCRLNNNIMSKLFMINIKYSVEHITCVKKKRILNVHLRKMWKKSSFFTCIGKQCQNDRKAILKRFGSAFRKKSGISTRLCNHLHKNRQYKNVKIKRFVCKRHTSTFRECIRISKNKYIFFLLSGVW